jgi:hypothetical protein
MTLAAAESPLAENREDMSIGPYSYISSYLTCVNESKVEDLPPVLILPTEHPQKIVLVLARITQNTIGGLQGSGVSQGSGSVGVGHDSQAEESSPW